MKLFHRRFGAGPPLIILHGLYGSSDNWVTIAKALGDHFTVFLPDQRNHGNSPHNNIHDYKAMSDDLYDFTRNLSLRNVFLAGHSMGGKTAIKFALDHTEMVDYLIIMDIAPFTDPEWLADEYTYHYNILKTLSGIDLLSVSKREEVEMMLAGQIPDKKVRNFIMKNLKRSENNRFTWKINVESLLNNLDKIVGDLPVPENPSDEITGFPVTFLKGEKSEYIKNKDIPRIRQLFPGAEVRVITNAGHWLNADNPDAVIRELRNMTG